MFRFANPQYLYLLGLVLLFVLAYIFMLGDRKRRLKTFGDPELIAHLMSDVSKYRPHIKFALMMLALALIIFMIARPQYGVRREDSKRTGIEAIIAVDVSNSMLCEDVKPNRLTKAKMIVSKLIDQLDEDRVGMIAFAGNAVTLLPLTRDGVSAKLFLEQISTQTVSIQGTNITEAIQRAIAGFSSSDSKNVGRALIFITDAEDNEDGAEEMAEEAQRMGVNIFVLSVGTESGGPIPMGNGRYKQDRSGNTVITHMNKQLGLSLAKAGKGVFIHVDQTDNAQKMLESEIGKMQKEDFMTTSFSEYDEQFIAVALLLLLVLIIEICLMERKNNMLMKILSYVKRLTACVVMLLAFTSLNAQNARDLIRLGNHNYRDGQYAKAETYYKKSIEKDSTIMETYYNLGNAQIMQGRDSDAYVTYMKAKDVPNKNPQKRAKLFHNMGNIMYASGLMHKDMRDGKANETFGVAVELFKSSLRLRPENNETRYNLAMAQYMFNKTKNDPSQNGQNNKDQNKENKNKDQQDKNKDRDQNKNQNKDDKKQQDKQDKQDQQKNNTDANKQNQENSIPSQKKGEFSENTVNQLLNSAQQDEKKVLKKLIGEKNQRHSLEKDW